MSMWQGEEILALTAEWTISAEGQEKVWIRCEGTGGLTGVKAG